MNKDELKVRLGKEAEKGRNARVAYNKFIKSFIAERKESIFQMFEDLDPFNKSTDIVNLRITLGAIKSLEEEILSVITTGEIASKQLKQLEETQNG